MRSFSTNTHQYFQTNEITYFHCIKDVYSRCDVLRLSLPQAQSHINNISITQQSNLAISHFNKIPTDCNRSAFFIHFYHSSFAPGTYVTGGLGWLMWHPRLAPVPSQGDGLQRDSSGQPTWHPRISVRRLPGSSVPIASDSRVHAVNVSSTAV